MAQVITKDDLDNLKISKDRLKTMTLDELKGLVFDTRNGLQSRKWEAVSRSSLSQSWSSVSRSLSQTWSNPTRS